MDNVSYKEDNLLVFLEYFILDTTLITLDTPDSKGSFLRREEPGSLRIIGKKEPTRR